jgi:hypothetical protein
VLKEIFSKPENKKDSLTIIKRCPIEYENIKLPSPIKRTNSADIKKSMKFLHLDENKLDKQYNRRISFDLPVKYKSINYFRLTDLIKKLLDNGIREIKSNNSSHSLSNIELSLYYMNQVEN